MCSARIAYIAILYEVESQSSAFNYSALLNEVAAFSSIHVKFSEDASMRSVFLLFITRTSIWEDFNVISIKLSMSVEA